MYFSLNFLKILFLTSLLECAKSVADGFYLITKPLSPGTHTIDFKGSLQTDEKDSIEPNYSVNVKYILEVQ